MFISEIYERKLNSSDTFYCRHPVSNLVEICEVVSQMKCFDICLLLLCIFLHICRMKSVKVNMKLYQTAGILLFYFDVVLV